MDYKELVELIIRVHEALEKNPLNELELLEANEQGIKKILGISCKKPTELEVKKEKK